MNYIKTLQDENKQLKTEILDIQQQLTDLRVYLQSSKFYTDTTVHVQDVLNRLPIIYNTNRGTKWS